MLFHIDFFMRQLGMLNIFDGAFYWCNKGLIGFHW